MNPPTPQLLPLNPPSPLEFPMIFHGGVGDMDIFWNQTLNPTFPQKGKKVFFFKFYFIVAVHRTVASEGLYVNLS